MRGHWRIWAAVVVSFVALLVLAASLGYTSRETGQRAQENERTAQALCDAAAGARDFWKKVRASTLHLLKDPELSKTERESNLGYLAALNEVIAAAGGITKACDGGKI